MADWLETKGLHERFLINDVYMHSFRSIIKATEKLIFPGVGAFEQLFGLVRGKLEQKFSKNSNVRGLPGGMLKLRLDWYITEWSINTQCYRFYNRGAFQREVLKVEIVYLAEMI